MRFSKLVQASLIILLLSDSQSIAAEANLSSGYTVTLRKGEHARVSPNFTAKEFACRHCGVRKVNGRLLFFLELLRAELKAPIIITSGFRCETHNKSVGGAKHSQHKSGLAADIKVKGYTPNQVASTARRLGFTFVKTYKTHTHVDVRRVK